MIDRARHRAELDGHPKVGASWKGFVLEEIVTRRAVFSQAPRRRSPRG